jgi:hypothetical protein
VGEPGLNGLPLSKFHQLHQWLGDVVKTLVFLTDWRHYRAYNEEYGRFFKAPYPARSTVGTILAQEGLLLEIEAVAVRGAARSKEVITAPASLWRGAARRRAKH